HDLDGHGLAFRSDHRAEHLPFFSGDVQDDVLRWAATRHARRGGAYPVDNARNAGIAADGVELRPNHLICIPAHDATICEAGQSTPQSLHRRNAAVPPHVVLAENDLATVDNACGLVPATVPGEAALIEEADAAAENR